MKQRDPYEPIKDPKTIIICALVFGIIWTLLIVSGIINPYANPAIWGR